MHYYQPMWTLVGGDLKKMSQSGKPMGDVLPKVLYDKYCFAEITCLDDNAKICS